MTILHRVLGSLLSPAWIWNDGFGQSPFIDVVVAARQTLLNAALPVGQFRLHALNNSWLVLRQVLRFTWVIQQIVQFDLSTLSVILHDQFITLTCPSGFAQELFAEPADMSIVLKVDRRIVDCRRRALR